MIKQALSLILIITVLVGCGRADDDRFEQRIFAMGTWVDIIIDEADPDQAAAALVEVERLLRQYERDYYAWTDGELAALNDALAAGARFEASPELSELLASAKKLAAQSSGHFEPGLGPLVALWGFNGAPEETAEPPTAAAIAKLMLEIDGIEALEIDGRSVSASGNLLLDLGGIAKGAVVDYILSVFDQRGIEHAMVNAGGDLRVIGRPVARPWRIGIQAPRDAGLLGVIELQSGEAAFTSGDYERYFDHDGSRMHHILDPATGYPVAHTQAVTVIANDSVAADAAATALFVAGPAEWRETAENLGIADVLRVDAAGSVEMTAGMRERLQTSAESDSDIIAPDF